MPSTSAMPRDRQPRGVFRPLLVAHVPLGNPNDRTPEASSYSNARSKIALALHIDSYGAPTAIHTPEPLQQI